MITLLNLITFLMFFAGLFGLLYPGHGLLKLGCGPWAIGIAWMLIFNKNFIGETAAAAPGSLVGFAFYPFVIGAASWGVWRIVSGLHHWHHHH